MNMHLALSFFSFDEISVQLYLPEATIFRANFEAQKHEQPIFPYWARLWPSAIAMSRFIVANRSFLADKKVLELAAGLGLPGLVAGSIAREVVISDYIDEAVKVMQSSIDINGLVNVKSQQLDWNELPDNLTPDVVLLSDINYDPIAFETLYIVVKGFLEKGVMIILTTPQRLMAKSFIERLLPWVTQQDELLIEYDKEQTFISAFVLINRAPIHQKHF